MPTEAKEFTEGHIAKGDERHSSLSPVEFRALSFGVSHGRSVLPTGLLCDKVRTSHYFENHCSAGDGKGRKEEIACHDKMEN